MLAAGWHKVLLGFPGVTTVAAALAPKGPFPHADYGSRCACCDQETTTRMSFDPSAQSSATPVEVPRCADCAPHVDTYNTGMTTLALIGLVALMFGLGWKNGAIFTVLGVIFAAALVIGVVRRRVAKAKLEACGHHSGLEIVAFPGILVVRSTNQRFIAEVRQRNRELVPFVEAHADAVERYADNYPGTGG